MHPTAVVAQAIAITTALTGIILHTLAFDARYLAGPITDIDPGSISAIIPITDPWVSTILLVLSMASFTMFAAAATYGHIAPFSRPTWRRVLGSVAVVPAVGLLVIPLSWLAAAAAAAYLAWQAARAVRALSWNGHRRLRDGDVHAR